MPHFSLENAMSLLEVKSLQGQSWQLERFRKWIESLVDNRGETFVSVNRRDILNQWEEFSKSSFKTCV